MARYHPRGSLAPRDIVARAIDAEMKRTGAQCVYPRHHAPAARRSCANGSRTFTRLACSFGIDMAKQPIPVVPAAHYQCGGVKTDVDGATGLPGLYAIGEVACTGLHGANRLASNSLLEGLVVAHRAAAAMMREASAARKTRQSRCRNGIAGDVQDVDELVVIYHNWDEIRRLMWDYVGIVRTDKRLQRASFAPTESPEGNPGILLEFQGVSRSAGIAKSGHGGGPDRR